MSFFEDDSFDQIVREFFGGSQDGRGRKREKFIKGEDEERTIDLIEDEDYVYLEFELPGFNKKDVSVVVKGKDLEINAQNLNKENIQEYLHPKLSQGLVIKKHLPNFITPKNFKYTIKNGILEIMFSKTKDERRKTKFD